MFVKNYLWFEQESRETSAQKKHVGHHEFVHCDIR